MQCACKSMVLQAIIAANGLLASYDRVWMFNSKVVIASDAVRMTKIRPSTYGEASPCWKNMLCPVCHTDDTYLCAQLVHLSHPGETLYVGVNARPL